MRRRVVRVILGFLVLAVGSYAAAGAVLGSRFDERVAAFRASDLSREFAPRGQDVPAEVNAAPLFEEAGALLRRLREARPGVFVLPAIGPVPVEDEDDARKELVELEPFRIAVERASARPILSFPKYPCDASTAHQEAMDLLRTRAQLEPERAVESADLLLRMIAQWQPRASIEIAMRDGRQLDALRIVRDVLARDPKQARDLLGDWRAHVAEQEPLRNHRRLCTAALEENIELVEQIQRGEDPLAETRDWWPWYFSWYGRPVMYDRMIDVHDAWIRIAEEGATEPGLRALLASDDLPRPIRGRCFRTLEQLAVLRMAQVALSIAAGEPAPEFFDPFTGVPLAVVRKEGGTVVTATPPAEFGSWLLDPDLFSWTVGP